MIIVDFNDISIKSASNKSGVFIGNNFQPNWDTFTKSNTNVSGNHVSKSLNVIIDKDGYDFTVSDHDVTNEMAIKGFDKAECVRINKRKKTKKSKSHHSSKKKPKSNS